MPYLETMSLTSCCRSLGCLTAHPRCHLLCWPSITRGCLDVHSLDGAVQVFFAAGLVKASHRTYETAGKRFLRFCHDFALTQFPVNESILCYFVACLGQQGLSAATIKTYLSRVQQMQIAAGHPELTIQLFPCMHQFIRGVELTRSMRGNQMRTRLPHHTKHTAEAEGIWWSQGS